MQACMYDLVWGQGFQNSSISNVHFSSNEMELQWQTVPVVICIHIEDLSCEFENKLMDQMLSVPQDFQRPSCF